MGYWQGRSRGASLRLGLGSIKADVGARIYRKLAIYIVIAVKILGNHYLGLGLGVGHKDTDRERGGGHGNEEDRESMRDRVREPREGSI